MLLLLESGIHVATAETITLTLSNGDKIQGKLVKSESTDTVTVIEHPSLGKLEIQSTSLKAKPKRKRWTDRKLSRQRWSMGLFVWYFGTKDTRSQKDRSKFIKNIPAYRQSGIMWTRCAEAASSSHLLFDVEAHD